MWYTMVIAMFFTISTKLSDLKIQVGSFENRFNLRIGGFKNKFDHLEAKVDTDIALLNGRFELLSEKFDAEIATRHSKTA